jgi:hypothetical protein
MKFLKIIATISIGIILVFSSCKIFCNKNMRANSSSIDVMEVNSYLAMNYLDSCDTSGLKFDTISKEEFNKYKKHYHSKTNTDRTKVGWTDTSLIVTTLDSSYTFPADTNDYSLFTNYNGYLKFLNLFIITEIDGKNEIGTLMLIDKKTNKTYYLESGFDDECEPPILSPKNNFLLSVSNDTYADNASFITLVKISKNKKTFSYHGFINFTTDQWKINDYFWIDDNSFALKVVTTTRNEETNETAEVENYLRVSF